MIVSIFSGLVSILHAYITMKQISRKMIVVPRIWNEKHKAYLDDNTYSGKNLCMIKCQEYYFFTTISYFSGGWEGILTQANFGVP